MSQFLGPFLSDKHKSGLVIEESKHYIKVQWDLETIGIYKKSENEIKIQENP